MRRKAFTIVELLVLIAIIVILVSLLMPALGRPRSHTRRVRCQNNLRQIALAMTNYEMAHMHFPTGVGIVGFQGVGSSDQLGPLVEILPYMDEAEKYDRISKGYTDDGVSFPAFPALSDDSYEPWQTRIPLFVCAEVSDTSTQFAQTHYGFCIGDRARNIHSPSITRGAFSGQQRISFSDIGDGSSNTIMAGEIGARTYQTRTNKYAINQPTSILEDPSKCFKMVDGGEQDWEFLKSVSTSKIGRGGHWADGRAGVALFNTVLPPMSPSVSIGEIGSDGIYSASGPHKGGLNLARMDGSTFFIDSNVDAGDSSRPTLTQDELAAGAETPYGVWGALGTIDGGEIVNEY